MQKITSRLIALVAALSGLTAIAATPVAVWDGFTGENPLVRGSYTWNKSANTTVANGVITIGSDGGLGLEVPADTTMLTQRKVTVIMDVANIPETEVALFDLVVNNNHVSLSSSDSTLRQRWNMNGTDFGQITDFDRTTAHRIAFTFEGASGVGTTTFVDGVQKMNNTGLLSSSGQVTKLFVGNYNGGLSHIAEGMTITKLALFDSKLTPTEVADYKFPSEGTTLAYTENVAMSTILTDMGAALKADVTIADAKTITVDVAVSSDKVINFACAGGTITLNVAEGIAYAAKSLDCAAVVKTGPGSITFTQDGAYTSCTIAAGSAATTAPLGFGAYTGGAEMEALSTITVGASATLDVSGSRDNCYTIVSNGGTLTNTGADIGTGSRQTTKLVLNAPTTVSGNTWGVRATGGKRSAIETNGNTLTVNMNEGKSFIFFDCTVTGGGKVSIESGTLMPGGACTINLTDIEKTEGMVLVEWAEGLATPTMSGVTFAGLGDFAWAIDTAARQLKLVSNVAEVNGTAYPTLAAAVAAAAEGDTITIIANCGGEVTLDKSITLACDNALEVSAVISGEGAITKVGAGTLTLAGANTFTGDVTVSAGVLKRGNAAAFGVAANRVTVVSGATLDMNNTGGTAYPITIAGAGSEGHPFALTSTGALAGLANITLADDATIGTTASMSINYGGGRMGLAGHKLSLVCGSGITGQNMNFSEGTLEIVSGRYTAYQWNNNGENTTLVVGEGATYASSVDGDDRCTFKHIVNNGTIAMSATHLVRAKSVYEGAGSVNNLGLFDGATNKLASLTGPTVSNRFVQYGALIVDLSDVELGEATEVTVVTAPEATAFKPAQVSVVGAEGVWVAAADAGVLKVTKVPALATVDGEEFSSVAAAFAAADGKTVNVLYSTGEAIVVDGDVTVTCADGVLFGGAITGTGSITIPEGETFTYTGTAAIAPTVKGAGTLIFKDYTGALGIVNGLNDQANWTGTFEFCNITCNNVGNNVTIQRFCNVNSTLRFNGYTQYLIYGTVNAKALEITNTMNLTGSYSAGPEFKFVVDRFSGAGAIQSAIGTASQSAAFKIVAKENSYMGSVTSTGNYRIAFLAAADAAIGGDRGCIYIGQGATATVAAGATWTATAGITVAGTLVNNGTLASKVTGAGEVVYTGALPADAATAMYTNTLWTGTVALKNYGTQNTSGSVLGAIPATATSWGHAGSKVQFTNVKAYVPDSVTSYPWTLVLKDSGIEGEYAWFNNNGYSNNGQTRFAALAGDGTFMGGGATHRLAFGDVAAFTGDITTNGKRITLGSTDFLATVAGALVATNTIATAGQTWTANGGVTIKDGTTLVYNGGALTMGEGTSLAASGTIKVAVAAGVTLDQKTASYKVLSWNAKPEGVTFAAANLPAKWKVQAKADGLYLKYQSALLLMVF